MKSDLVDLALTIHADSGKAIQVSNLRGVKVWLPRSQIEVEFADRNSKVATVTVPGWLAKECELI